MRHASKRCVYSLALIQVALNAACTTRVTQTLPAYDERVGLVVATAERLCLTTKAPSLPAKTVIRIIDPPSQQQSQATIVGTAESCVDPEGQRAGLRGYAIQFAGPPPQLPFYGIGVLGASAPFRTGNGSMIADVDGDHRDEFFRSCTSAEGLHLTIWTGSALTGERRWHRYQPLGYDVSPTCTPAETAGP
jgi:hypothetical protein